MDGTLLDGRVIYSLGRRIGLVSKIEEISQSSRIPYVKSQRIARLLRGLRVSEFITVVKSIPLMRGAEETVRWLQKGKHIVGIISDSYTLATKVIADRLELDFHVANVLKIENGVLTGGLKTPLGWERVHCSCRQSVCKRYHLMRMAKKFGAEPSNTVAVGDSYSGVCMIENAGVGIWFNPPQGLIPQMRRVVAGEDLSMIKGYLKNTLGIPPQKGPHLQADS
jgi:phosphoserine phosphatase